MAMRDLTSLPMDILYISWARGNRCRNVDCAWARQSFFLSNELLSLLSSLQLSCQELPPSVGIFLPNYLWVNVLPLTLLKLWIISSLLTYCHLEGINELWSCPLWVEAVPLFLLWSHISLSNFRVCCSAVEVLSGLEFGKWAFRLGATKKHQMQLFTVILMEEQGRWMVSVAVWLLLVSYWMLNDFQAVQRFFFCCSFCPLSISICLRHMFSLGKGAQVQTLLQFLVVRQLWAKIL